MMQTKILMKSISLSFFVFDISMKISRFYQPPPLRRVKPNPMCWSFDISTRTSWEKRREKRRGNRYKCHHCSCSEQDSTTRRDNLNCEAFFFFFRPLGFSLKNKRLFLLPVVHLSLQLVETADSTLRGCAPSALDQ